MRSALRRTGVTIDRAHLIRGALAGTGGLLAAFSSLAVAELAAALVRPESSPVVAVGGALIDLTPTPVKDWAIRTFGTNDKVVLQAGIFAVLGLLATVLGLLAVRHRRSGALGVLAWGVIGAAVALGRPDSRSWADALPSLAGAFAGAAVLRALAGRLNAGTSAPGARGPDDRPDGRDRRGFLLTASAAAAASVGAGALGRGLVSSRRGGAATSRAAVVLPTPGSPAPVIDARAALRIPGASPFTTPSEDFYRVDTALVVPRIDAGAWRLKIRGKGVTTPLTLTLQDLLDGDLIERDITLTCVSNEVGGPYVGTARWTGVRLSDLLGRAGVEPPSLGGPADQLVARSVDGMTFGTPVEDVMDGRDAMLAVGMNGEPLPFEHGFPARMVVPGLYGYVSACKWIEDLELTTFDAYDPYWVKRNWARRAPIKTQSRIDTPRPFARPAAGTVLIAGVAWAQQRGVDRVEVRVDDGPWRLADLASEHTTDTWRQWSLPWKATSGTHTLTVRATDRTGETQTGERARTVPDGATGWHSVVVMVT
ncbi:molybdopterin-dependent oxidoreductase [Streptomyces sp. NPDC059169]|uniref:molybdopterin-dependent oxidoreductase n=1 Tax=Streptomyces sp. NPDC059169 TaxID=3346754 RepID=UPI0036AF9EBC